MIAGPYHFTGEDAIVQGKTFRRRFRMRDVNGALIDVSLYHFRCKFKNQSYGSDILFLSTDTSLSGLTSGSVITREPDGLEGTIELYIPDETMEGIEHTAWTEVVLGGKAKYFGFWELEGELIGAPGDTNPILAGKVQFIREVTR